MPVFNYKNFNNSISHKTHINIYMTWQRGIPVEESKMKFLFKLTVTVTSIIPILY